ncbi:MAG: hypothetical protein HC887_10525 [Desulfobacteraceae bacterium]|nr:hypothetical protein [Desulfobacteraceae bacterium]
MSRHGELLVAIINNYSDFRILSAQQWYRIPLTVFGMAEKSVGASMARVLSDTDFR